MAAAQIIPPLTGEEIARLLPRIFDALPIAVAIADAEGCILACNAGWRRAAGNDPGVRSGATLDGIFPALRGQAGSALRAARPIAYRATPAVVPTGGSATWWDVELVRHPDHGAVVLATARNATEDVLSRREAEDVQAALSDTASRLVLAQEVTGIGIWELDVTAGAASWSPAQFRMFGMDPSHERPPSPGKLISMVHRDDRAALLAAVENGFDEDGQQRHVEFRITRADTGEERLLLTLGRAIARDANGRPLRLMGVNIDVTAQYRARRALVESEARLRMAFEAAHMFAWDWDVQTGGVVWMDGLATAVGLDEAGFGGTVDAFRALVHPDDSALVEAALGSALRGEVPEYRAEFRMRRADGSWRWTKTTGTVQRASDGSPRRVIGVDFDITEQRAAEAMLRESESRFRGLFDSMFHLTGLLAPDGSVLKANRAALEFGGVTLEQVLGQKLWDTVWFRRTPAEVQRIQDAIEHAAAGKFVRYQVTLQGASRSATLDLTLRPVRDQQGRVIFVVPEGHDITELTAARQDARQDQSPGAAEQKVPLRDMLDALPLPVFTVSGKGRLQSVNRRWLDFTGQSETSVLRYGWLRILHPADRVPARDAWARARENDAPFQIEHRMRAADGSYRWFLTRAERAGPPHDNVWYGAALDISCIVEARATKQQETAQLRARLAERTNALREAGQELAAEIRRRADLQGALLQAQKLEALGQMTGSVAHDFNNVLAAIVGSYSLIRRRSDNASLLQIVEHGEAATQRATRLIQRLMGFARRVDLTPEMLNVPGVLHELQDLITHAAGGQVSCRVDTHEETWPVLADSQRLGTALLNLVANGRDAMPDGGVLRITATNLRPDDVPGALFTGDYVSIAVRDGGMGMPPDIAARAQEPFFTTKPFGKGTGLGLAMVRDFATSCGGCVRIQTAEGQGTTVEIILPRAPVMISTVERRAALRKVSGPSFALHGDANILLVEDDEQLRPITAAWLRELGYEVVEAATAEAALALAHTLPGLDLLIADVMLPRLGGRQLAAKLRADHPNMAVLYVTGRAIGPELDGETVLNKPYSDSLLAKTVLQKLGRKIVIEASVAEPLLSRLRSPELREILIAWHAVKADGEGFPHPSLMQPAKHGLGPHGFVAAVEHADPPLFHYIEIGGALTQALAQSSTQLRSTEITDEEILGTLDGAYRSCARSKAPVYQSARYDFGDGAPFQFQRLILPASENGQTITHLVGVVLLGTPAADGRRSRE